MVSKASSPILVIDDDRAQRGVLVKILALEGFPAHGADDGAEALEWLARGSRPRLIVLDLHMRGMDGATFLERLREDADLREIPVVVATGARAVSSVPGARLVLRKPLDFEHLLEAIRAA
jgi:CheY-like chemotaxis protein